MNLNQLVGISCMAGLAAAALAQQPTQNPNTKPPGERRPDSERAPSTPAGDLHAGYMKTPRYAQPLAGTLAENSIQLYVDKDFKGEQSLVSAFDRDHRAGTLNAYPANFDDSVSSLRWNLPVGTLVIMFDDAAGKGHQLALWGSGQIADMDQVAFENSASRWAWYDVGGGANARSADADVMPQGAQTIAGVLAPDSIRLFDDQDFKENEQAISPVTIKQAGNWHELPGEPMVGDEKENAASSLRWNLPDGVIVLLSAKDDGTNNIVLFGKGEYSDLAACDFNNCASRWSWAYIGQPKTADSR